MKTIKAKIVGALALLVITVPHTFAVEDLRIEIDCPNVVLSWPSVDWSGETFIVQYRPDLSTNSTWTTLTNSMPADFGTNRTYFVHADMVQCSTNDYSGGGGGGGEPPGPESASQGEDSDWFQPMVVRKDGSLPPLPLAIYPPGIDLPEHIIIWPDGSFDAWTKELSEAYAKINAESQSDGSGGPQTENGGEDSGGSVSCGFYRVVRTGVWLYGLTNGTALSGIVTLPVEAGYTNGTLSSVTISANGSPIEGTAMLSAPLPGMLSFAVDTRRLLNGDYYFQANGVWTFDSTNEFDAAYTQFYSPVVFVTVSNQVTYPDWVEDYRDDLMLIKITSTLTNVDWQLDVYGETGNYVGSFTNHSDDGIIDFSWDLRDGGGVPQTDNTFTTVTTLAATGSPAVTETNPPLVKVVDNYPDQGLWMAARASYMPVTLGNYDLYTNTVNYFAQMGEAGGGCLPGQPYRNPGQVLVLSKATGMTNWAAMYRGFTNHNVRNFYFDGHGGPDFIGYGWENGEQRRTLPSSVVAEALGTTTANTNAARYRWVWIDSCSSALGSWPRTFGLGNRENVPLSSYTSRPGAFCGFTQDVYAWTGFHGVGFIDTKAIDFRGWFIYYWWFEGDALITAFDQAEFWSDFDDAQYLKVFGYWGLGWNTYNSKAEWPPSP